MEPANRMVAREELAVTSFPQKSGLIDDCVQVHPAEF